MDPVAFISTNPDDYEPLSPPGEPDFWVKIRPMMAGDLRVMAAAGLDPTDESNQNQTAMAFLCLPRMVLAWNHPAPVSLESVDTLDSDVLAWLLGLVMERNQGRSDEKKDTSNGHSAPTSRRPRPSRSPVSSGI